MRAKCINENFNKSNLVSKFRRGMQVQTKDNLYYIKKVEDHSYKYDIVYVNDKNGKNKIVSSDWLEQNGTIIPSKKSVKSQYPSMTAREYMKQIKYAINGLKQTVDDAEDPGSYIYDSAESMIYDESLYNYLYKKYKKEYNQNPRHRRELIELLANDMSNNY